MRMLFLLGLGLFYLLPLNAQDYTDPDRISLPSVNNQFTTSNATHEANLYNGIVMPSVSLLTLPTKGDPISIGLTYVSGGGIKVQDVAGYVGLGWRLNAGGAVSRIVRGLPDETPDGYIGTGLYGQYITAAGADGITYSMLSNTTNGIKDGEPDIFNITTPFFSVQFSFDEGGNPVFAGNNGLKVSHNFYNNSDTLNTYFTVTDSYGNKYYFGTTPAYRESTTTKIYSTTRTFISTWYLERIEYFNKTENITFQYRTGPDYAIDYTTWSSTLRSSNCNVPNLAESAKTILYTQTSPKYISSINSGTNQIYFEYSFDRTDIQTYPKLTSVALYAANKTIKRMNFEYSYFGSNAASRRLRLDKIYQEAGVQSLLYKAFEYNTTNLPERASKEFDYWGYYNVNTSGSALVPTANKNANATRAKAGILTKITNSLGGSVSYEYELNTYFDASANSNLPAGGVRLKRMVNAEAPESETSEMSFVYDGSDGRSTGQLSNQLYKSFDRRGVTTWLFYPNVCVVSFITTSSHCLFTEFHLNGENVGYSTVKTVYADGSYSIDNFTNYTEFPDVYQYKYLNGAIQYQGVKQLDMGTSYRYKRGLPIKNTQYTAAGSKVKETENEYMTKGTVQHKGLAINAYLYYVYTTSEWIYNVSYTPFENYRLVKSTTKEFGTDNSGKYTVSEITYDYKADNRLINTTTRTDSKGNSVSETFYYPTDPTIPMTTTSENTALAGMAAGNFTDIPVHTTQTKNGIVSQSHLSYSQYLQGGTAKYFLSQKNSYIGSGLINTESYTSNFADGKVLTSKDVTERPVSSVYGYNGQYEVARIEGMDYSTVLQQSLADTALLNNINSTPQAIATELQKIRNNLKGKGVLVTTATYEPLIGKTSETDAAGVTTYYEYDVFKQLALTKDHNGNIVKRTCYGYIDQPDACPITSLPLPTTPNWVEKKGTLVCLLNPMTGNPNGIANWMEWDMNPGSPTYLQSRNMTEYFHPDVCLGDNYCLAPGECEVAETPEARCIGERCEIGVKVYIPPMINPQYPGDFFQCKYRYEWSDGFQSPIYTEYSQNPCD